MPNKRLNKRASFDDLAELFMAALAIIVLGTIIVIIVSQSSIKKNQEVQKDLSYLDAGYQTRVLLNHEIRPGYKMYDLIIDSVNSDDFTLFEKELDKMMKQTYDPDLRESWFFAVNSRLYKHNVKEMPIAAMTAIDGVIIPNPNGANIRVLFKKITPSDFLFESTQLKFYT
jgi:hypothetical protein